MIAPGLRTSSLAALLLVGTIVATDLSVGTAIAAVTLPSVAGFLAVNQRLQRTLQPLDPGKFKHSTADVGIAAGEEPIECHADVMTVNKYAAFPTRALAVRVVRQ